MRLQLPAWPASLPRRFRPRASLENLPRLSPWQWPALAAHRQALRVRDRAALAQCSGVKGTWAECLFSNSADYTAIASFTTETSLLSGLNVQPYLPAMFWDESRRGRAIRVVAKGVLSTTGAPTYTFQVRLGTTSGPSSITGTSVGVSAAITTASGVTNAKWELVLDLACNVPGIGASNTTLSGAGYVASTVGFASPFTYDLEPTTPPTATWTSTIDCSATQYLNLSVVSSASSASNALTCKLLQVFGWN